MGKMECNSLKSSTNQCFCSSSGSIASGASSGSSRSSTGTVGKHGLRTVHLKRQGGFCLESTGKFGDKLVPNPRPSSFGFSFRGGREFGTGFFVSAVENDSEAQLKGLKVGDQIVRINGLSVEDATHQEVLQLAQSHQQLTLTVKSVGLIPVKDKSEDPLTWKVVENGIPDDSALASVCSDIDRLRIEVPDNSQLGCGICKGPDWRPGIFVQYTKPNSLARRCGLQPGDQILQCNRISFLQIDFSYAVGVLKNANTLNLVLKKGSGIDLFPGESSGYSSSSSIADDAANQTSSKTKRLSMVAEESEERYHRKVCHCKHPRSTLKSSGSIDSIFDCISGEGTGARYRERSKSIEILTDCNLKKTVTFKNHENVTRTLLNGAKPRDSRHQCLAGNQTVIKIERKGLGSEGQTVPTMSVEKKVGESLISVEVRGSSENCGSGGKVAIEKSPSSSSFSSGSSLSSAISREIQRRNERKSRAPSGGRDERSEGAGPAGKQHRQQHDMLIAELKRKQGCEEKTSSVSTQTEADKGTESHTGKRTTSVTINGNHPSAEAKTGTPEARNPVSTFKALHVHQTQPPQHPPNVPPACPTPDYYSDNSLTDQRIETSHIVRSSILKFEEKNKSSHQPNAVHKTVTFGQTSTKEITPIKNLPVLRSPAMSEAKSQDVVEMQSIESYELTEPRQVAPKPPPVYFQAPQPDPKKRTTVIKITEYPTERRREPAKLDFLQQKAEKEAKAFESELASTLSRSNLRNKMEAFANVTHAQSAARNAGEKTCPAGRYSHGYNGLHAAPVIPTFITENQLSNVKKALKSFEKNTSNTVLLKIPKRN